MTKFCPNCGNKMSDNVKFCMECGAKLSEYTSSGVDMHDSVVQRSQVGAASVGNVNISPVIAGFGNKESEEASTVEKCPKCGSAMREITGVTTHEISYGHIKTILTMHHKFCDSYICPKCRYKRIYSLEIVRYGLYREGGGIYLGNGRRICPECGGDVKPDSNYRYYVCERCKWRDRNDDKCTEEHWEKLIPLKQALQLAGYDVLF